MRDLVAAVEALLRLHPEMAAWLQPDPLRGMVAAAQLVHGVVGDHGTHRDHLHLVYRQ